ncbi:MAG: DNA/RNA non-specific endonuclease, partial [bacterium]
GYIPPAYRTDCQASVGTWGSPPSGPMPNRGYQGGHLIATSLGGTHRRYNLTPQAYDINVSSFQRIENGIRSCARRSDRLVAYSVTPVYDAFRNPFSSIGVTPIAYIVGAEVRKQCSPGDYRCGGGSVAFTVPNWTSASGGMWVGPAPGHPPLQSSLSMINRAVDAWVAEVAQYCQ